MYLWMDKGPGLEVRVFIPNPFERVTAYWPTWPEILITIVICALGPLLLTLPCKVALAVKAESESGRIMSAC